MGSRLHITPIIIRTYCDYRHPILQQLCLTFLLHFTSIQESSIHWFIMPITLITLFIGGLIAGYKAGGKGWYLAL